MKIKSKEIRNLTLTQAYAAVLQQVAQMIEHGALVLSADSTEVAQETTAVGHHLRKSNLLERKSEKMRAGDRTEREWQQYNSYEFLNISYL